MKSIVPATALLAVLAITANHRYSTFLRAILQQSLSASTQNASTVLVQTNEDRFKAALQQHPFTEQSPENINAFKEIHEKHSGVLGFGHGGREAFDGHILKLAEEKDVVIIMEVGVWLGQSLARWLSVSPKVRVIGVDPFRSPSPGFPKLAKVREDVRNRFGQPSFNRALAEYTISKTIPDASSRTLLLTGYYPEAAEPVLQDPEGPEVDVFYLDGGKNQDVDAHLKFVRTVIEGIVTRFPNVLVAGDDWGHGGPDGHAPQFQSLVRAIAKNSGRTVKVYGGRTWVMVQDGA